MHVTRVTDNRDPNFENVVFKFNIENGVTPALVNAIRRTALSEIPCFSLGLKNNKMLANSSFLNTDYIRHRVALLPIYQEGLDSDTVRGDHLIFRICDPDDYSRPLVNNSATAKKVLAWTDLIALKLRPEFRSLEFGMEQLSYFKPDSSSEEEPAALSDQIEQTGSGKEAQTEEEGFPSEEEEISGPETFPSDNEEFEGAPTEEQVRSEAGEAGEAGEETVGPILKTREDWEKYYERVDTKEYIKYNFYLTKLKFTEEILLQIIPDFQSGLEHTTFEACTQAGYWFGDSNRPIQPGTFPRSKEDRHFPKEINLELEFNGHYPNLITFKLAIASLREKIMSFRNELEGILEIKKTGAEVSEEELFQVTSLTDQEDFLVLHVKNESHTLGQLIATYGTRFFQKKVEKHENRIKMIRNFFCSYRLKHPLEQSILIQIKTPDTLTINDAYIQRSRPYQLLFSILDDIDKLLSEIDADIAVERIPKYKGRPTSEAKEISEAPEAEAEESVTEQE